MVTIQQRAIQQQQARVEAQPLTRTQRKRIQLARRTYIPPPPQAPVTAPQPTKSLTWKEQQQQQAQTKLEYYQKKLADAKRGDNDEREQKYDSYVAHLSKNMYLIDEGYSYRQVLGLASAWTEYDLAKRDARIQAQKRAEEYERSLEKPEPEKPAGIFVIAKPKPTGYGEWIDIKTGAGYSAEKPKSPFDVPASQFKVTRMGDIPIITKRPTPTPPPPAPTFPTPVQVTRTDLAPKMQQEIRFATKLPEALKLPEAFPMPVREVPIDIRTGKPFGTVEVAPTKWETYKKGVKERGPVTTTLRFISSEVQDTLTQVGLGQAGEFKDFPLMSFQEPFQAQAVGRLGKTIVEYGPYFTPAGPSLLITTGAEQLAFKGGREELKYMGEELYEKTEIPITKHLPYGLPVAKIGLGALGISKQVKGFQAKVELKKFGETPMIVKGYRFEAGDKGFDILTGTKQVGKAKYVVKLKQPYYMTREGKAFLLESGKLEAYRIKPAKFGKIEVDMKTFEVTGKGFIEKGVVRRVIVGKDYTIKAELFDVQKALGVTKLKGQMQFKGKIDYGVKFPTSKLLARVKGKAKPFTDVQRIRFLGLGKGDKIIKTINADIDKVYYSVLKDQFRITTKKITSYGKIKKITPSDFGVDVDKGYTMFVGGGKKSSQAFLQGLYSNQQKVVEQALKSVAPSVKPIPSALKFPLVTKDIPKPISQAKLNKQIKLIMEGKVKVKPKEKVKIKIKEISGEAIISKTKQNVNQIMKQMEQQINKTALKTEQALGQVTKQKTKTIQLTRQRTLQRARQGRVQTPAITYFPTTKTPFFALPPLPPMLLDIGKKKKKLKKKIKKKLFPEFAYLSGFTERAIGLKAIEVTEKEAQQLIKKVMTGAEIRRPVRIKRKKLKGGKKK